MPSAVSAPSNRKFTLAKQRTPAESPSGSTSVSSVPSGMSPDKITIPRDDPPRRLHRSYGHVRRRSYAVVRDPPYGIGFMGKEWDTIDAGDPRRWAEMGGPTGRDNTTHSERGGAMHEAPTTSRSVPTGGSRTGAESGPPRRSGSSSRAVISWHSVGPDLSPTGLRSRGRRVRDPGLDPLVLRVGVPEVARREQGHRQGGGRTRRRGDGIYGGRPNRQGSPKPSRGRIRAT